MHELTVAVRIREALEEELAGEPGLRVSSVRLEVGALSGVVPAALEFAWDHAVAGSALLEGSRLAIDRVDVVGHCATCDRRRTVTGGPSLRCPTCDEGLDRITGGDELDILSVDVVDPVPSPTPPDGPHH